MFAIQGYRQLSIKNILSLLSLSTRPIGYYGMDGSQQALPLCIAPTDPGL
jgi:hypothetical protein